MGWRVAHHYDEDARDRRRALPLRERYAWRRIGTLALVAIAVFALWLAAR